MPMITEDDLMTRVIALVGESGTAGLGNNYNRLLPSIQQDGKWNGDLRVKLENPHKGKIHSWMASVITSGQKRQGPRLNHFWGVRLRGYLFTWDNGDLDNSEKYIRAEVAAIKRYFAERKDIGLDQVETGFMYHKEIQETNRAVQHGGNGSAHVVNLFLGCHLYELLTNP